MIDGLLILLLFQFLGEVLIHLTGLPLPAPVVGMILLLFALMLGAPGMDTGGVGGVRHSDRPGTGDSAAEGAAAALFPWQRWRRLAPWLS